MIKFNPDVEQWAKDLAPLVLLKKNGVTTRKFHFPQQNGVWEGVEGLVKEDTPTQVKVVGRGRFMVKVCSCFYSGREVRQKIQVIAKFEVAL